MTQETEKEDPRQVPPKQFASERPRSEQSTKTPGTGGLRDDVDDARGAVDDEQRLEKESHKASDSGGKTGAPPSKAGAGGRPKGPGEDKDKEPGRSGGPSAPGTHPGSSGASRSSGSGEKR